MIPRAVWADLNRIQTYLTELQQRRQIAARPGPAVLALGELVREDVRDQGEPRRVTYRTRDVDGFAHGLGGSQQIRVGVTNLEARHLSGAVREQDGAAGE
jgi:hypothetical protein